MAKTSSTSKSAKTVETLKHEDATRKNIPTAEYQSVLDKEQQNPKQVRYPRNTDLDPQLVWRGKDEQDWSDLVVHAPPLYIQEKVHPKALIDDLLKASKEREHEQGSITADLFADFNGIPKGADKTEFYQHDQNWSNRMILGDSLQVMASLAEREGLRGKVQCIYFDPPYGIKFNSNFQWSTTSRDVKDGNAGHITREPEQVKAFRDTWRDGIHSYLTYLRDRLTVARDLLTDSGSIFVQIGDENVHRVRAVMDEVFGDENVVSQIAFRTTAGRANENLAAASNYLIWAARDKSKCKYRPCFQDKSAGSSTDQVYALIRDSAGKTARLSQAQKADSSLIPADARVFRSSSLTSSRPAAENDVRRFAFQGQQFTPGKGTFKTVLPGLVRLGLADRFLVTSQATVQYVRYLEDFPVIPFSNMWTDTGTGSFTEDKVYVVQTGTKVIERCLLMTTDPGDLALDPTCGSGTTATVAEQWGRRWITCDTSRVPLALARQRLLTATFPYYELKDPQSGPQGGFVYKRRQNRKGEEVGGLVPHITLKSIANNEPPATEVLVDRPEVNTGVVRVAGPFVVEATIAPPQVLDDVAAPSATPPPPAQSLDDAIGDADAANGGLPLQVAEPTAGYGDPATHINRMTQVLRQSKTLRLPGNRELVLGDIRRSADSDVLHAEGVDAEGARIAITFGPEDGAISSNVVFEAAREAYFLKYTHLYFFGFAIQAKARELLDDRAKLRVHCTYVTVTPDVAMSDLLKTSRASEIFSVTGLPDAVLRPAKNPDKSDGKASSTAALWEVELRGLDIFHPETMEQDAIEGQSVPAWMLDTDYDGMCFYATQVFFPKTAAWDNLQKSLKAEFDPSVWEHLAGTVSEPFALGDKRRVAVKVIDERGNELMRVLEAE